MRAKRITQMSLFQLDYIDHPIGQALKAASAIIDEHPEWIELIAEDLGPLQNHCRSLWCVSRHHPALPDTQTVSATELPRIGIRAARLDNVLSLRTPDPGCISAE